MWEKVITPRFKDMDALKHINNNVLPVWFDMGKEELYFKVLHPRRDSQPLMARNTIDFLKQMRFGSDVLIKTYIKKIGNASLVIYQEAWQNGELAAKSENTLVYYDMDKLHSRPIPDDVRVELAKHMVDKDNPNISTRYKRTGGSKG